MGIDKFQAEEMFRRVERNRKREPEPEREFEACDDESKLQQSICDWAESQWPQWCVLRSRFDRKSTIGVGIHDITIWGPFPLCICVEAKKKSGKLSEEQQIWKTQMGMLGWKVNTCFSFDEFLSIVDHERKI